MWIITVVTTIGVSAFLAVALGRHSCHHGNIFSNHDFLLTGGYNRKQREIKSKEDNATEI